MEHAPARRFPSLDGLRAIAIGMVLVSHAAGTRGFPIHQLRIGELGVRVFFVISGFLITTLLAGELDRTGDVSLGNFYVRRAYRIVPAYATYVVAVVVLGATGTLALHAGDVAHAATFTTNYHPDRGWALGHTWSLAVEEQFYLLWPALLAWLGRGRGLHVALGFVVLAPIIRLADWYALPGLHEMSGESFWTCGDALAIGAALALGRQRLDRSTRWQAVIASRAFVLVPIAGAAAYGIGLRFNLPSLALLQTIELVAIAACLDRVMRIPDDAVGKLLNARPIAFVGTLSYSLYLWQQLFLDRHTSSPLTAFPLNVALAFAAALASYYLVEKPMLARRPTERRARARAITFA